MDVSYPLVHPFSSVQAEARDERLISDRELVLLREVREPLGIFEWLEGGAARRRQRGEAFGRATPGRHGHHGHGERVLQNIWVE